MWTEIGLAAAVAGSLAHMFPTGVGNAKWLKAGKTLGGARITVQRVIGLVGGVTTLILLWARF